MEGEIIVVDNASQDGSRDYLEPRFPDVHFLWNETNPGFAIANNQALAIARGEFILFLNPDTIVPEDCFHRCVGFLRQRPDAGALGIRMLDGSGRFLPESKRAFPSPITSFFKLAGLAAIFPKSSLFARYYMGHLDPEKNHETDVLAGAFMMIKKPVLDKTGGFDEAFFMYGEDIDLSYRIQKAGFKNYYFAETPIIHFKGESTKKGTLNYVRIFYKAMHIFVAKHYSGGKAGLFHFFINAAMLLSGLVTSLSLLFKKAGFALMDMLLITASFWLVKTGWHLQANVTPETKNEPIFTGLLLFTLFFYLVAWQTGLYERKKIRGALIYAIALAALPALLINLLLPESLHFSSSMLLYAAAGSFILLSLIRLVVKKWRIADLPDSQARKQSLIVANREEYQRVANLRRATDRDQWIPEHITASRDGGRYLELISDIENITRKKPCREIIFCENGLSFKEIIDLTTRMKKGIRIRISASGSQSVVGSDSKESRGTVIAAE